MKNFSIIVAFDEVQGIGKAGLLPWHLPADLKHFKEVTMASRGGSSNAVIMGRKTWESIPDKFRPLPGRLNIVITSQEAYALPQGVLRASSLDNALEVVSNKQDMNIMDVFVIGGAQVFAEAIAHPLCKKIYLTRIYGRFDCDVFFPVIPLKFVEKDSSRKYQENEKTFSFFMLEIQNNRI
jgi:dihydrofolate reductase